MKNPWVGFTRSKFATLWGVACLSLALNTMVARGATIQVRKDGTGNYTTIQAAVNAARAGDVVIVNGGTEAAPVTYSERVTISSASAGTASNLVTIKAEPRRGVLMNGFRANANYVRIEGFQITTTAAGSNGGGVWVEAHGVQVVDNYLYEIPEAAIFCDKDGLWQNIHFAQNHIYRCNRGMFISANGALIENNEIERLVQTTGGDADYFRLFGDNITVRRNYMHGTLESEIGGSHTDGWQTYGDNGDHLRDCLIEGNVLTGFYRQGFFGTSDGVANYNLTFRNNVIHNANSWGFSVKGFTGVRVYNNTFANMGIHGCALRNGSQGEVYNNLFYDGGSNYWADPDCTMASGYNLIEDSGYPNFSVATDLVNVNPQLLNPANLLGADGQPFTADDGFQLLTISPARDAGTNLSSWGITNDILGNARLLGAGFDIGAYEYLAAPPPPDTQAPSVPQNLSASAVSSSQIDLSWNASTDNVGVTGYRVYRNGSLITTVAQTSYSNTGLAASTTYNYNVSAIDAAGNASAQSSQASATTQAAADTQAPSVPQNLSASAVSSSQIDLSWNASTDNVGVTGYRVYRNGSLITTVAQTSYSDTGLSPATTYNYNVSAIDAAGNASAQSSQAGATTQAAADTQAPSVPQNVSATAVSTSQINLSWNASTDNVGVTGYRIYRDGSLITTVAQTSYSDTGLSPATTYNYNVSAIDAAGNESAQSSQASATTPDEPAPVAIAGDWSFDEGSGTVSEDQSGNGNDAVLTAGVQWAAGINGSAASLSDESHYVQVGTTNWASNQGTIALWANPTATQDSYLFGHATLPWSNRIQLYLQSNQLSLGLGDSHTVQQNIALLANDQWQHVALTWAAGQYAVYINGNAAGGGAYSGLTAFAALADIGNNGYLTDRTEGFQGRIDEVCVLSQALSAAEVAALAAEFDEPADTVAPSVPQIQTAEAVSSSQIDLAWSAATDNVGVAGYNVYRDGALYQTLTQLAFSDTGLAAATSYEYAISAFDAAGNESAQSAPASVQTDPAPVAPELWYFAEGDTRNDFETFLLLVNPSPEQSAEIELTLLFESGAPLTVPQTVGPNMRYTFNLKNILANNNKADQTFAMVVNSTNNVPVYAERAIYWPVAGLWRAGGMDSAGSRELAPRWMLAEGSTTGGRTTMILIANPNPAAAELEVKLLLEGEAPVTRQYQAAPQSRLTIDAASIAPSKNFSIQVQSLNAVPVVVERSMYGTANNQALKWGHNALGVTQTSSVWYLAEGATHDTFETFLLLANPNPQAVTAELRFLPGSGSPVVKQAVVTANGRLTINIEQMYSEMQDNGGFSITVAAQDGAQILVERAMYWRSQGYTQRSGATSANGIPAARPRWFLPEGAAGGFSKFESFILAGNPNSVDSQVRVTLVLTDGSQIQRDYTLGAGQRLTVKANDLLPNGNGANTQSFSTIVETLNGVNVIAERTMYWTSNGKKRIEGHASSGIPQ